MALLYGRLVWGQPAPSASYSSLAWEAVEEVNSRATDMLCVVDEKPRVRRLS